MKLLNSFALTLLAIPTANAAERADSSAKFPTSGSPTFGLKEQQDYEDNPKIINSK